MSVARLRVRAEVSARELQMLQLAAEGWRNDQIAAETYVSVETVKSHLRNVYGKLGARGRAHAVALALREGLIS